MTLVSNERYVRSYLLIHIEVKPAPNEVLYFHLKADGGGLQLHIFVALALEASDQLHVPTVLLPEDKPLGPTE